MAKGSHYCKEEADFAVAFIENLKHTKGTWYDEPFELIDWQEQIIRDIFGTLKSNGYRQFNTAYITSHGMEPRGSVPRYASFSIPDRKRRSRSSCSFSGSNSR